MEEEKIHILSLGGSLFVPDEIDGPFIKRFCSLIRSYVKKGHRFYIVVGGGSVARQYQGVARSIVKPANDDLDWIGIRATHINASLLRTVFGADAAASIFTTPDEALALKGPVVVGGGWKPGWSTDYVAVCVAAGLHLKTVVNLSNIDYIYDGDPNKVATAIPQKKMVWKDVKKLVGAVWIPGSNVPFDPKATHRAAAEGMRLVSLHGRKLDRLKTFLDDGSVLGTIVE